MFAELTLRLHEMLEPANGRGQSARNAESREDSDHQVRVVVVTGLPSTGKASLIDALRKRLLHADVVVESRRAIEGEIHTMRVHAETDLEAMVEGAPVASRASRDADMIVPVDWEPTSRSVARIVEWLIARGIVAPEV